MKNNPVSNIINLEISAHKLSNTLPVKIDLIKSNPPKKIINPNKKHIFRYTTVSGVDGFDGTRKEAEKPVVQSLND